MPVMRDGNILKCFMTHDMLPTELSAQSSKHRNREELKSSGVWYLVLPGLTT